MRHMGDHAFDVNHSYTGVHYYTGIDVKETFNPRIGAIQSADPRVLSSYLLFCV